MIKKCKICGTLSNEIKIENIGKIDTRKLCNDCILLYQKCIAKLRKGKKFKCEFAGEVRANKGYTMNCFYFGCIHQINGDCPILNGGVK